jgi:hypothetical protein
MSSMPKETEMHCAMKELPVADDYGDGFCSRLVAWGAAQAESDPRGLDAS